MVSKVFEFGDTAFVVLRKQDLKFIHYYHHVVTAVGWWYMYPYYEPVQMWFVVMNSFVHSLMYPYYALRVSFLNRGISRGENCSIHQQKAGAVFEEFFLIEKSVFDFLFENLVFQAMKISLPKIVAMVVTSVQILQMFAGVFVNFYSIWLMYIVGSPEDCPDRVGRGVLITSVIYFIFSFLFFHFFITNYITGTARVKSKKV